MMVFKSVLALIKRGPESFLTSFTWNYREKTGIYVPGTKPSPDIKPVSTIMLDSSASRIVTNQCPSFINQQSVVFSLEPSSQTKTMIDVCTMRSPSTPSTSSLPMSSLPLTLIPARGYLSLFFASPPMTISRSYTQWPSLQWPVAHHGTRVLGKCLLNSGAAVRKITSFCPNTGEGDELNLLKFWKKQGISSKETLRR